MKKYFVFLKQQGEGCDYTIGCGMTGKVFEAKNLLDLYKVLTEYYGYLNNYQDCGKLDIQFTEIENMQNFSVVENEVAEYNAYLRLKEKFDI